MNRKMQIVRMTLCMALLLAWGGLGTASAQVGLKFSAFDHSHPAPTEVAGYIPQANWNLTSVDGAIAGPGSSMLDPVDATGAPVTGMKIEWKTNVGQYYTWMAGTTPDRYLFTNALYGVYANAGRITLTGVPYPSYAVIIYSINRGAYQYWDQGGDPATRVYGLPQLASEYTDTFLRATRTDAPTANLCNYWIFTGITSANVTFNWSCGAQTSVACAIQIVPTTLFPQDPLTDDLPLVSPTAGQTNLNPQSTELIWHYRPVNDATQFKVYLKAGGAPGPGDVIATAPYSYS